MNLGNLNQRNDELFDKLDSTSKKDVNKLIQLQKETSTNSIGKQIRDSLEAIEENLFKLDSFDVDSSKLYGVGKKSEEKKQAHEKEIFSSIVDNLSLDNDGFLKKIEPILNGVVAISIPNEKNSYTTSNIYEACEKLNIKCFEKSSVIKANNFLIKKTKAKVILITGSLYLIGKIREKYL